MDLVKSKQFWKSRAVPWRLRGSGPRNPHLKSFLDYLQYLIQSKCYANSYWQGANSKFCFSETVWNRVFFNNFFQSMLGSLWMRTLRTQKVNCTKLKVTWFHANCTKLKFHDLCWLLAIDSMVLAKGQTHRIHGKTECRNISTRLIFNKDTDIIRQRRVFQQMVQKKLGCAYAKIRDSIYTMLHM